MSSSRTRSSGESAGWLDFADFADASKRLRSHILVPSGGWLADVIVLLSTWTGIWDVFLLAAMFILSWVVLRTSATEISLILGNVFDVTIPLQHHLSENKDVQGVHKQHLAAYWPFLWFGLAIEAAAYFLVHPDLFTLVVCIKTTVLTVVWLGRSKKGSFWTSQWDRTRKGESSSTSPASTASSSHRRGSENDDWDKQLRKAGYTDEGAREAMIDRIKKEPKDKQEETLRRVIAEEPDKIRARNEKYAKGQRKKAEEKAKQGGTASNPSAPSTSQSTAPAQARSAASSAAAPTPASTSRSRPAGGSAAASSGVSASGPGNDYPSRFPARRRPKDIFRGNIPNW